MITVLLVNNCAEVLIRRYETESADEACRSLVEDWIAGKIKWAYDDANKAFTSDWLRENGFDPLSPDYSIQEEKGVRILTWQYIGDSESDDQNVTGYFVKSVT